MIILVTAFADRQDAGETSLVHSARASSRDFGSAFWDVTHEGTWRGLELVPRTNRGLRA